MQSSIFKAYDIRGKYPDELNEDAALKIAAAVGRHFGPRAKIIVGRDGRLSSPTLYKAVLRGLFHSYILENVRMKIIDVGLITTPMLYFLVNKLKAGGGIMVTASHNPKEYNGLKVVGKNARPISGLAIKSLLIKQQPSARAISPAPFIKGAGSTPLVTPPLCGGSHPASRDSGFAPKGNLHAALFNKDFILSYINFLKSFLRPERRLKVVFDCSNGTTGRILRQLTTNKKQLTTVFLNDEPDGNFSAHGPNPLAEGATRQLSREVKRRKADLGVIFDADGDRVFFLDNKGQWVDPNEIGYILMQLFKPPYVVGIVSSWRLKELNVKGLRQRRIRLGRKMSNVYVSRVGHYFFKKLMREKKASLGLEHSGHYYFRKFFYCDSGIFAAIQVINFVSGLKTDFASWLDSLPKYYRSGEINFKIADAKLSNANDAKEHILDKIEKKYKKSATKINKIDGLTMEFSSPSAGSGQNSGEFWFNVRPSNTEPLLRLNIEATDKKSLEKELQNLGKLITL